MSKKIEQFGWCGREAAIGARGGAAMGGGGAPAIAGRLL